MPALEILELQLQLPGMEPGELAHWRLEWKSLHVLRPLFLCFLLWESLWFLPSGHHG